MEKQEEIWKIIEDTDNGYAVSNLGRIKTLRRTIHYTNCKGLTCSRILKEKLLATVGYPYPTLNSYKNGVFHAYLIHRLVATYFVENPEPEKYKYINHLDGNKQNNHYSNLVWCNPSENVLHAYKTGLAKHLTGKDNPYSMTVACYTSSGEFVKEYDSIGLTKLDGFSPACVWRVCKGLQAKHKAHTFKFT